MTKIRIPVRYIPLESKYKMGEDNTRSCTEEEYYRNIFYNVDNCLRDNIHYFLFKQVNLANTRGGLFILTYNFMLQLKYM